MNEDFTLGVGIGITLGAIAVILILSLTGYLNTPLSSDTLHDICTNFTSNKAVEASISSDGKLNCSIPTFDHTQNIIISGGTK